MTYIRLRDNTLACVYTWGGFTYFSLNDAWIGFQFLLLKNDVNQSHEIRRRIIVVKKHYHASGRQASVYALLYLHQCKSLIKPTEHVVNHYTNLKSEIRENYAGMQYYSNSYLWMPY